MQNKVKQNLTGIAHSQLEWLSISLFFQHMVID